MTQKRKISARKILQAIATLLLLCCCATAVLSTTKLQANRAITGISVVIVNSDYGFVDKAMLKGQLEQEELKISETKLKDLNIHRAESILTENAWVAAAEVYVDNARDVKVAVVQRVPVVRLFTAEGESYYLDSTAHMIPLSQNYVHYATTVINVPIYENDTQTLKLNKNIVKLSGYIENDSFWKAQVSHVAINKEGEFELTPVLGKHIIKLGDAERLEQKFANLLSFYTKVLNRVGWDKYEVLDVRYKGQLVGSPSIKWNVPVDKVRNRINWVSSITGETPKPIVSVPVQKASTKVVQQLTVPQLNDIEKEVSDVVTDLEKQEKELNKIIKTTPEKEEKVKKEAKEPKYLYQGN